MRVRFSLQDEMWPIAGSTVSVPSPHVSRQPVLSLSVSVCPSPSTNRSSLRLSVREKPYAPHPHYVYPIKQDLPRHRVTVIYQGTALLSLPISLYLTLFHCLPLILCSLPCLLFDLSLVFTCSHTLCISISLITLCLNLFPLSLPLSHTFVLFPFP